MEIAFDAIGLDVRNKKAFDDLAQDAILRGVASRTDGREGVLHSRCWRIGEGIEVWALRYESEAGEVYHTDCRPGFRARFVKRINPWLLIGFDREREARIRGYIEDSDVELSFDLQNLTEVGAESLENDALNVRLCGLATRAEVGGKSKPFYRRMPNDKPTEWPARDNLWEFSGEVIAFNALRNPFSGNVLYWIRLDFESWDLEVLVNQRSLIGSVLELGSTLTVNAWLQGHVVHRAGDQKRYEGIDPEYRTVDFWKRFKRLN